MNGAPDDAAHDDKRHRREYHQAVVGIAGGVERLRHHLHAEQRARAEQLAEKRHDYKYDGIADAVAHPVEKRRPGTVGHGERLKAPHQYTVCDNQAYKHRELHRNIVGERQQQLVDDDNQTGHHHKLYDDTYVGRDSIAYQRYDDIGESEHRNHRHTHHYRGLELRRDSEHRTDTEYLHHDRIVLGERIEKYRLVFYLFSHSLIFLSYLLRLFR